MSDSCFYNDMLADTVGELEERGIATESEGALCAFPDQILH